jgi:hypothetical protein
MAHLGVKVIPFEGSKLGTSQEFVFGRKYWIRHRTDVEHSELEYQL